MDLLGIGSSTFRRLFLNQVWYGPIMATMKAEDKIDCTYQNNHLPLYISSMRSSRAGCDRTTATTTTAATTNSKHQQQQQQQQPQPQQQQQQQTTPTTSPTTTTTTTANNKNKFHRLLKNPHVFFRGFWNPAPLSSTTTTTFPARRPTAAIWGSHLFEKKRPNTYVLKGLYGK